MQPVPSAAVVRPAIRVHPSSAPARHQATAATAIAASRSWKNAWTTRSGAAAETGTASTSRRRIPSTSRTGTAAISARPRARHVAGRASAAATASGVSGVAMHSPVTRNPPREVRSTSPAAVAVAPMKPSRPAAAAAIAPPSDTMTSLCRYSGSVT